MGRAQYQDETFCKITNYETLRRELEHIQRWQPDVVVVDEAHK